jgi:competence protein ComEC
MRRPLAFIILAYMGGVLAGDLLVFIPLWWLFVVAFSLLVGAWFYWQKQGWLVLGPVFMAGWINMALAAGIVSPADLRRVCQDESQLAVVQGVLITSPEVRIYSDADGKERTRSVSQVRVQWVRLAGQDWQPARGDVQVMNSGVLPEHFRRNQAVRIDGVLARPPRAAAPGLFDFREYLRREGVYFQLRCSGEDWAPAGPPAKVTLEERFTGWAKGALVRGLGEADEVTRLRWAMSLGLRGAVDPDAYQPFLRAGTMHLFAISGLHVAFLAGALVVLLRVVRLPRWVCGAVAVPLIWFYAGATGWQVSAVRASVMMSLVIGGWAFGRPTDLLNCLCAAALLVLLWEPRQLFTASFQLSFCVVLCIGLLSPVFEGWRNDLLRGRGDIPEGARGWWASQGLEVSRWGSGWVVVSLAAWVGATPLCTHYFHVFSPVALVANVVVVPTACLALACSLGSVLCGVLPGPFCELFNQAGWFLMGCMVWLSQWGAALPGSHFFVQGLSKGECAGLAGVLVAVVSWRPGWQRLVQWPRAGGESPGGWGSPWREPATWSRLAALAGGVVLAGCWCAGAGLLGGKLRPELAVLSVDGGVVVYCRDGGGVLLVDCGRSNGVERVVSPFLQGRGVNRIDRLVLTHGDVRHVAGAELVRHSWNVRETYASGVSFRSQVYRAILGRFEQDEGVRLFKVHAGDAVGRWEVLHPPAGGRFAAGDDGALVLRGNLRGLRVLLVSDLGAAGQEMLLASGADVGAEVVVTGLPSRGEALGQELLERIGPKLVIVGDSDSVWQERASGVWLDRVAGCGARVVCTSTSGGVLISRGARGWDLVTVEEGRVGLPGKRTTDHGPRTTDHGPRTTDHGPRTLGWWSFFAPGHQP